MIDIEKLKALEKAATSGDWQVVTEDFAPNELGKPSWPHQIERRIFTTWNHGQSGQPDDVVSTMFSPYFQGSETKVAIEERDANLIVAMRNALPDLLALLEEARELADAVVLFYRQGCPRKLSTLEKARAFLAKFDTKREG